MNKLMQEKKKAQINYIKSAGNSRLKASSYAD